VPRSRASASEKVSREPSPISRVRRLPVELMLPASLYLNTQALVPVGPTCKYKLRPSPYRPGLFARWTFRAVSFGVRFGSFRVNGVLLPTPTLTHNANVDKDKPWWSMTIHPNQNTPAISMDSERESVCGSETSNPQSGGNLGRPPRGRAYIMRCKTV
jgi:hypothetical protein